MKDDFVKNVHEITPPEWDKAPLSVAGELRAFLASIQDTDTDIDGGSGDGHADLYVSIGGIEYRITIQRSFWQKERDKESA